MTHTYSTTEVERMIGVPFTTFSHWIYQHWFTPSIQGYGSGSRHRFTDRDVYALRVVKRANERLRLPVALEIGEFVRTSKPRGEFVAVGVDQFRYLRASEVPKWVRRGVHTLVRLP